MAGVADFLTTLANVRGLPIPDRRSSDGTGWWSLGAGNGGGSIELADGTSASYLSIYRDNVWVRAAVNKIVTGMMRMPTKTYTRNGRVKERNYEGRLYDLMERRPMAGWTPARHRGDRAKHVAVFGNAITVKLGMENEGDTPDELFRAPSTGWTVSGDGYYTWTNREGKELPPFPRWKIIHDRYWDTDERGFGVSPLESLRKTIQNEDAARRYSNAAFKNGARPGSVLKTDQTLKQETAQALKADFMAIHGGVDNYFKVAVLQQGLDFAMIEHDLEKAAVVEHREFTPVEVAAAYDIPPVMLGWQKEANFASIDMYHTMLFQDSLGPWVVMFEETTQLELVDPCVEWVNQFVEIDMHGVLRGDASSQYRNYATGITTGFLTPNEVRSMENLPPSEQPEANMLLFPMNLSGAVGAQLSEDNGQEDKRRV